MAVLYQTNNQAIQTIQTNQTISFVNNSVPFNVLCNSLLLYTSISLSAVQIFGIFFWVQKGLPSIYLLEFLNFLFINNFFCMQKGLLYWNSIYLLDSGYIYWTRYIYWNSIYRFFVAGVSVQPFCGCTLSTRALLHARVF